MTWLKIVAAIAVIMAVGTVVLVLALCRATRLSDEVAEQCNRAWLIGPGRHHESDRQQNSASHQTAHDDADHADL